MDLNTKDKFGRTPLHIAADNGNFPCAKLLVEHKGKMSSIFIYIYTKKADTNVASALDETPLMIAINNSRYSVALLLVDFGCYLGFYLGKIIARENGIIFV